MYGLDQNTKNRIYEGQEGAFDQIDFSKYGYRKMNQPVRESSISKMMQMNNNLGE